MSLRFFQLALLAQGHAEHQLRIERVGIERRGLAKRFDGGWNLLETVLRDAEPVPTALRARVNLDGFRQQRHRLIELAFVGV